MAKPIVHNPLPVNPTKQIRSLQLGPVPTPDRWEVHHG